MSDVIDIDKLKERVGKFASERDWEQFHNPKNLAMALSVESSELVEIFQWLTHEQSLSISKDSKQKEKIADEISDIIVYAIRLCGVLNINLSSSIDKKMIKNGIKYPIDKSKGNAKKYNEF